MEPTLLRQSDQPLFPKVLWNRPVSKKSAGRLLLIGGCLGNFQLIQAIYRCAVAGGIGQVTMVLPDSLRPLLPGFEDMHFVASSPTGSIGRAALEDILRLVSDYDALSIGANLSNNSETTVVMERLIDQTAKPVTLYQDSLNALKFNLKLITGRGDCVIIISMTELWQMAGNLGVATSFKPEGDGPGRVEVVAQVAQKLAASLVVSGRELIIASEHKLSVTPDIDPIMNQAIYAIVSLFWTWPHKSHFEQLTSAAYITRQVGLLLQAPDKLKTDDLTAAIEAAMRADPFQE